MSKRREFLKRSISSFQKCDVEKTYINYTYLQWHGRYLSCPKLQASRSWKPCGFCSSWHSQGKPSSGDTAGPQERSSLEAGKEQELISLCFKETLVIPGQCLAGQCPGSSSSAFYSCALLLAARSWYPHFLCQFCLHLSHFYFLFCLVTCKSLIPHSTHSWMLITGSAGSLARVQGAFFKGHA